MKQDDVKDWLKENNRTRAWLADQCEAATQTVNNWLSTDRGIPNKAVIIIERLMEADRIRETEGTKIAHALTLEFSSEDFDAIEEAAHRADKKIRTWATDTLRNMATRKPEDIFRELQAAEDPEPYTGKKTNAEDKPA